MPYVVLRHLAVRPDFAPGDRPQFLFSFRLSGKSGASQAVARPKISAADHSHVVARAQRPTVATGPICDPSDMIGSW